MYYREIKTDGFLSHFVKEFWEYANHDKSVEHTILPDGLFDLIVEFADDQIHEVKLTGIWTEPINVKNEKTTRYFGVRFKLLAVEYIFNQEIKSILNTAKPLPFSFWEMDKYTENDFEKFVSDVLDKILQIAQNQKKINPKKLELFNLIYQKEYTSVERLSRSVGWSSRQINRYFRSRFGFTLKEFINIIRFKSAFRDISEGNLFPEKNYFDQAHFIKEIKKYTGVSPKKLYKNENDRFLQFSTLKTN